MPNFTDITGLASAASALAVLLLPWTKRLARSHRAILLSAVFVVALIPFGGLPLAAYMRGVTGDLSITTMVLMWCALLKPLHGYELADSRNRLVLLALTGLGAVLLYPLALGFGAFDPYRLGYGGWPFVAALLLVALAAWHLKNYLLTLCFALAMFAWSIGWYESGNLWDYLLDPFVSAYALAVLSIWAVNRGQARR